MRSVGAWEQLSNIDTKLSEVNNCELGEANKMSKGQEVSSDVEDKELLYSGLEEMHKASSQIPCIYLYMFVHVTDGQH